MRTRPAAARVASADSAKCSISGSKIFEDLLGLGFRMGILSQSLFMEESDEFTRRLCGVWLSHLGGYFQRWRIIAEVPTLGNEVEPLRLELPL